MGEVAKSHQRRLKENWFEKYAPENLPGIDIGCQTDPLNSTFRKFDLIFGDGDATFMADVPDESYHTVFASHIIEHLVDPITGIQNWYRITKTGGHLIIVAPHRDLYEKKKRLPSNWNFDHKTFWLPEKSDPPDTWNFKETILRAIPNAEIVLFRVLDEGFDYNIPANQHSVGEYSIEAIIHKT